MTESVLFSLLPIDFQTTDAGPIVGTSDKFVKIRLTESFIIHDIDLDIHYAPSDSKSHKVEQVMSNLNEACGDRRFIEIPYTSMVWWIFTLGYGQNGLWTKQNRCSNKNR